MELRIPWVSAGPRGLQALLVRPAETGRYPLAVITHGTPATAQERAAMTPQLYLPAALEFARRGWTTVIIMRRGYGTSGGRYTEDIASCDYPDYMRTARELAKDLRAAITFLSTLPEVDSQRIIAIGGSGGGLAVIALTADPLPGLSAGINFSGGWGHLAHTDIVCQPGSLLSTLWLLGKKSRIPMLWVYPKNDHIFNSDLALSFYEQFTEAGGKITFLTQPFGSEGHSLFSPSGIPVWTRYVDDFLQAQNLTIRAQILPLPPAPNIRPPRGLTASGGEAFQLYLSLPPEKAFAVDRRRNAAYEYGQRTTDEAKRSALARCEREGGQSCRVVMLNDVPGSF